MIAEALQYLATAALTGRGYRRFVRYSVNLWSRAGRCSRDWAAHEENSKNAVRAAISGFSQRRTAVVLGSGLLRDVPIEDLADSFDTVVLVDLVHLASVRLRLRGKRYRNVRLIERDVSGYDDLKKGENPEPLGFLRGVPYLDFVVSANLLSQIGRGVKRQYETEASSGMPADTVEQLMAAHIQGLAALPCRSCLVTDISYVVIDRTGRMQEEADLLHGIAPPEAKASWDWPVAPFGEESRDYEIVHKVIAAW